MADMYKGKITNIQEKTLISKSLNEFKAVDITLDNEFTFSTYKQNVLDAVNNHMYKVGDTLEIAYQSCEKKNGKFYNTLISILTSEA